MPIFDYRCKECSTVYDIYHKGKELSEDIECPQCGSHRHIKLFSPTSIINKEAAPMHCRPSECRRETSCCSRGCPID